MYMLEYNTVYVHVHCTNYVYTWVTLSIAILILLILPNYMYIHSSHKTSYTYWTNCHHLCHLSLLFLPLISWSSHLQLHSSSCLVVGEFSSYGYHHPTGNSTHWHHSARGTFVYSLWDRTWFQSRCLVWWEHITLLSLCYFWDYITSDE